jgi:hypothetical protein
MGRTRRNLILYIALGASIRAGVYLILDFARIGAQAQGPLAKFVEGLLAVGTGISVAARRYVQGIDPEGVPTPDEISALERRQFTDVCAALLSELAQVLESLMNSGFVYSRGKKAWKVVLVGSAGVGITVSLVTGTGTATAIGAGSCTPGIIDAIGEVVGRSRGQWQYW